jgi:RimJ/RimL family protein N-acetyltransferase
VIRIAEGNRVRLRIRDKEDLDFLYEFWNNINWYGEFEQILPQMSKTELAKRIENPHEGALNEVVQWTWFIIEKKDGTKIGAIIHFLTQPDGMIRVGYALVPSEREKGFGTEALQIMVDYLFLTREVMRIGAETDVRNKVSQRILEKVGFKREGTIRKATFLRGEWTDDYVYGILREEWKKPGILKKTAPKSHAREK